MAGRGMSLQPPLSTSTQLFAVFGQPIAHSLSPAFQNAGLEAMGIDGRYLAFEVGPDQLEGALTTCAGWSAGGVNLTIPLKETAFRFLQDRADSAEFAGSVNTVVFEEDGHMVGHSTDGAGLREALTEAFGGAFEDRRILVFGCGGAGRAAALQAAREGASEIVLANRTRARAESVENEIRERLPGVSAKTASTWPPSREEVRACDVIIQSTSLGMKPGEDVGVKVDAFREGQAMLDMTYVLEETPMMGLARSGGAKAVNGIGMLLHQGVESLRLWTGQEPPVEIMRSALQRAVDKRNASHV